MGRIMALDVGEKRIGIALSDVLHITAQPLQTYERVGPVKDVKYIGELVATHGVEKIVCGMPLNMNGSAGATAQFVEAFADSLKKSIKVPIVFFDERLSSKQAERVLIDADMRRDKRKKVLDKMAAVVILQGYLG